MHCSNEVKAQVVPLSPLLPPHWTPPAKDWQPDMGAPDELADHGIRRSRLFRGWRISLPLCDVPSIRK